MPTVHLSLPESLYEQLKEIAESMGIQVTDLIKIYIKQGVQGSVQSSGNKDMERRIEVLEENILFLMAMYNQLSALVSEMFKKLKEPEIEKIEISE
ncbi:MAG: hypothetical protein JHC23_05915 [Sulfolobus sp.]|jgi:antitoxin component of RelBE/YafQ-DinJ toxin-antitoxin module|nr:hypothetical protein [Sulfolobus sp.]